MNDVLPGVVHLSSIMRNLTFFIGENKGADQLRSVCEANQRLKFVLATQTVLSLYFLHTNFPASSHFLCLYCLVCVGLVRNLHCWFSHDAAYLLLQALIAMWIPGAIFGGMCLLLVILALRLPESATHELPSTMKDRDTWTQKE